MAVIKAVSSKAGIGHAIDYVTKKEKTEEKLVSGLHCEPETVKEEMQATKELWGKTDGRTYKHYVQSYHEDEEITPEQAHKNAIELAEHTKAWKGHEVLIATHIDKGHIHTHFIVNSVNYENGHKLQWSKHDLKDLKERCNEQSREQGLHVPEKGKTFAGEAREEIETTKTDAGTRVLPITEDVAQMFQAIIEDRNAPKVEKTIDGYSGFLFYDDNGMPLVAMHWQHRFNRMVGRYNDIYRVQMPNITPHVCRHTYCSNMAKSGMNPKTLQYLMGHSDISVTMNVYTHIGFDDAEEELKRMEEFRKAQAEVEQKKEKLMSQKMFKVV
ncbi:relaxase/mobilization nuclease domain-containing protein [Roseburia lenta]|uniref:relaxase/mobilization nuclease domain-containing protein n=1 Tax=Roseburia lenta TaxID=2763061 RepID=UPI001FAE2FC5|nr:relaxase/mobilization nuclease domain-containing protein [Roseburia lenta]